MGGLVSQEQYLHVLRQLLKQDRAELTLSRLPHRFEHYELKFDANGNPIELGRSLDCSLQEAMFSGEKRISLPLALFRRTLRPTGSAFIWAVLRRKKRRTRLIKRPL